MRLIDANNLKLGLCEECKLYPDKCLKDNCDWNSIYHIKIEPTVDAIPIDWIMEYPDKLKEEIGMILDLDLAQYIKMHEDLFFYKTQLSIMCERWKDENE